MLNVPSDHDMTMHNPLLRARMGATTGFTCDEVVRDEYCRGAQSFLTTARKYHLFPRMYDLYSRQ